jgi:carboxylesterase
MHCPTFQKCNDANSVVIFIHGLFGSPNQFVDLAEAVYNLGCAYKCVLLPGHGKDMSEFSKFGGADWQRHLQNEIDTVKHDYKKIFLVGHSMGGLLALNAGMLKENNISGIFLIATPLKVHTISPKAIFRKLQLLRLPKDNEIKSAYMSSNSVKMSKRSLYLPATKTFREFFKLMKQTKKRLSDVLVPVYMIHSKNDETTSYMSAALLYKGLCSTQREAFSLEKSWHAFYVKDEQEIIKEKLSSFMTDGDGAILSPFREHGDGSCVHF